MNNFIFYSPTEFVFGRDTEAQTGVVSTEIRCTQNNDCLWWRFRDT
jgi:alcohol dehydrogenase YqhD (iron-dependent ADH family)